MAAEKARKLQGPAATEPASSILAAHLAPHLSPSTDQRHAISRETFSQLRQEILGQDEGGQSNLDENITDMHNLICVVIKAGLQPAFKTRVLGEELEGQILDCLDIIRLAVQRSPQVLHEISDPEILGKTDIHAPLFAWLIHELFSLLFVWDQCSIRDKIYSLLSTIYVSQFRGPQLWHSSRSVHTLVQACIGDILYSLEATGTSESGRNITLYFPGPSGILLNCLDKLSLPRSMFCKRIRLGTPREAVRVCLQLFEAVACPPLHITLPASGAANLRRVLTWVLHSQQKLWAVMLEWFEVAKTTQIEQQLMNLLDFITLSRKLYSHALKLSQGLSLDQQARHIWLQCGIDLLNSVKLQQNADVQQALSQLLSDAIRLSLTSPEIGRFIEDHFFEPLFDRRKDETGFRNLHQSFQMVIIRILNREYGVPKDMIDTKLLAPPNSTTQNRDSITTPTRKSPSRPILDDINPLDCDRARKRPRLSNAEEDIPVADLVQTVTTTVYHLLASHPTTGTDGLSQLVLDTLPKLPEEDQCEVLAKVGRIACAGAGTLVMEQPNNVAGPQFRCLICDSISPKPSNSKPKKSLHFGEVCKTMIEIIPILQGSKKPRIAAMFAIRSVVMHDPKSENLGMHTSPLGEWCLQSLRSSLRELRMAAGQTLPAFLRANLDSDVRRANFVMALEYLQNVLEKVDMPIQETSIMALSRVAEVSGDEEMNIILLRLFEYLGHPNPFISGIAYTGLSTIAQRLGVTPGALCRPFWRTLSVVIVKNIQGRPQMADQLCDLLGMKVDNFLRLTEVHVLPYLVLMRKYDIIARIGANYDEKQSPYQLCTRKNNLASILTLLLTQPSNDHNAMVVSIFNEMSPEFQVHDLAGWVRAEPILIACELLKGLGDSTKTERSKYHKALKLLASLTPRKPEHGSDSPRGKELVANFIEEHVLGIITEFAHVVNDFQIRQPIIEKKRNIIAIGEMVKIAKGNITIALPQICACLRSALDIPELCDQAFASWSIIMTSLDDAEIEPLIDQTFSIIIKNWDAFQPEGRERALNLVGYILTEHRAVAENVFETMPSLSSIPAMADYEEEIQRLKERMDLQTRFKAFCRRCQNENQVVVEQALKELDQQLVNNEEFIHRAITNEQPDGIVALLTRSLLDCCSKFNPTSPTIMTLAARCLGHIGCLDPNRIESVKEKKDILVLSNFDSAEETLDFILFFLQHILVEAFLSVSNTRAQGFLAYAMQALLKLCNLDLVMIPRSQDSQANEYYRRWLSLPEYVRNTLTPFLSSKYTVTIGAISTSCDYPLFSSRLSHPEWLRAFTLDMLQKGKGENVVIIFSVSSRIIRSQDISIAAFLLPFAALNLALSGDQDQRDDLKKELLNVLQYPLPEDNHQIRENIILCSESVFAVLDYLSRWLQGKKKEYTSLAVPNPHNHRKSRDPVLNSWASQIKLVEELLSSVPAEIISKRAVECKSFSRALFHWEQYIQQQQQQQQQHKNDKTAASLEPLYQRLQEIYTQIDEPDGIEGISSHLHVLNIDQQILEHRKAGRWVAAQSWYELQLKADPTNGNVQENLLTCLKESGQHVVLLNQFDNLDLAKSTLPKMLPITMEASWLAGRWNKLDSYAAMASEQAVGDFNVIIGSALSMLRHGKLGKFEDTITKLRLNVAKGLTSNSVASFHASHDSVLKLHALAEIELLTSPALKNREDRITLFEALDRRLDILGGCIGDKQYLLGLRRATMELTGSFDSSDIASIWLRVARLARKANRTEQAFNAVLHAHELDDTSATIEHARLLWKEGHHRKAIQTLEGAIAANAFTAHDYPPAEDTFITVAPDRQQKQNMVTARAHLLLARWMDSAGQTQSEVIVQRYRQAIKFHSRWEKAHYYLGRHYTKILDSEKSKPLGKEAQIYLSGEASKLVIDNFLRSLAHGNKYVFQTLPKVLTLWLEHAATVDQPFDPKRGDNEEFQKYSMAQKKKCLDDMHTQLRKYISRIPAALLFTILPQVVARICHSNSTVYNILNHIVVKTGNSFPQQALWTILAVLKSSSKERASRGMSCLQKITEATKKMKTDTSASDLRMIINQGQRFSEELLKMCYIRIEDKTTKISLARNLGFNHRTAPCRLVIPLESTLTPILPANHEPGFLKSFRAFPHDPVTIETVLDDALVLNSLQKPRKINIRGSDGKIYSLLCKPKDDLRKDQRLMEFNSMINRFLKRDVESSKRRLYIKTYAVTPLNEECGLIEWVDNLRTLRELVIRLLKERGIIPNYNEIRHYLNEACADSSKLPLFTNKILATYPPVLHEWFVEMFPEPGAWFAARLKYTRSSAVMSMVGYCLGLGDRHGENILFEEGSGGVLHVDFNCLFDKGLTFEKPELVPFRLTQNMINAFGAYGYNGPFRKTCEIALGLLRQNEDSLMTILETFLHDPTTDFIGRKKRTNPKVPDTPEGVLESVRSKLRGLLPGESVPLSIGGHVDELIIQATNIKNLAAMYIGWCAFF
ncbi:serine/threonine-protein kinase ATR [Blastomyces parvus]|uniref:Serine/threonine-protein kinase MEC1 n=1 Tax=Blastomyces parvus TaxID=2060905 RepID=A0A2B7WJZ2_9EURO|nr:serine/threonine-protein kinase ATR [Blastomyces parvus]